MLLGVGASTTDRVPPNNDNVPRLALPHQSGATGRETVIEAAKAIIDNIAS